MASVESRRPTSAVLGALSRLSLGVRPVGAVGHTCAWQRPQQWAGCSLLG